MRGRPTRGRRADRAARAARRPRLASPSRRPEHRRDDDHGDEHAGGGTRRPGEQAQRSRRQPLPPQERVQRPRAQRGEQALGVDHRLDDRVRLDPPQHGEHDSRPPAVDEVADGEDPPRRRDAGQPRGHDSGPEDAQSGDGRDRVDQVRIAGEEDDVRVDEAPVCPVRQARVVAVLGDVDEPAPVEAAEQRRDVLAEMTRHDPEHDETERARRDVTGERGRRRAHRRLGVSAFDALRLSSEAGCWDCRTRSAPACSTSTVCSHRPPSCTPPPGSRCSTTSCASARDQTHEPFVPFDAHHDYDRYVDGLPRSDGVRSFLASRRIELPEGDPNDPPDAETIAGLGNRKNELVLAPDPRAGRRAVRRVGALRQGRP